jgi:hypothetical protein
MGKKDYKLALNELLSAKNEEEAINCVLKIVKGFEVDLYKNDIFENPYFKSLLPEVKEIVITDLEGIRNSLNEEIIAIEKELKINDDSDTKNKLKSLKNDCLLLISELDNRINDLEFNLI